LRGYWRLEGGAYCGSGVGICESYSGGIGWTDYTIEVEIMPLIGEHHYVNARVQGALYSYAFGLAPDGQITLYRKDKAYQRVESAPFAWAHGETYRLSLSAHGDSLTATATAPSGVMQTLTWRDADAPYLYGQIGLSTWNGGNTAYRMVKVHP
jgi:hypothetical protein